MKELNRIRLRMIVRLVLLALPLTMTANAGSGPAHAQTACSVTLEENDVAVAESKGTVDIIVELEGGQVCAGLIKWSTKARTARAPGDFRAASGELRWTATDQERRKPIRVSIVNDSAVEGKETFAVELADGDPNDNMTLEGTANGGGGPVTVVTITDDDPRASSPQPGTSSTRAPGNTTPTSAATAAPTTAGSLAPTGRPSTRPGQPATQGPIRGTPLASAGEKADDGSNPTIPLVIALLVLGGVGALILKRRGT